VNRDQLIAEYKALADDFDKLDAALNAGKGDKDELRRRMVAIDSRMREIDAKTDARHGGRISIADPADGRRVATGLLTREQRLADRGPQNRDGLQLGYLIACAIDPEQRAAHPAEARVLAEGAGSTGGLIVPTPLANQVIDKARNATRVIEAGALTVPMDSKTLTLPRITAGTVPGWRGEGDPITEDDLSFDGVELDAKSLSVLVKASREVLMDMTPAGNASITNDLASAIAAGIDLAALRGTGANDQPEGLAYNDDVHTETLGSSSDGFVPTDYSDLVESVARVKGSNFNPNAAIMSARTEAVFGGLTSSADKQPLQVPPYLAGVQFLASNQVPNNLVAGSSNATTSQVFVGQWDQLVIGVRENMTLQILTEKYADTGQVGIIVHFRGDVGVLHEEAFDILEGVGA
jgi:HK97 family phage major capsid protein